MAWLWALRPRINTLGSLACSLQLLCLSECISKCDPKRADGNQPRPAHQLISFKLLGLSDIEEIQKCAPIALNLVYSRTSMAQTLMARLPRLFRALS